MSNASAANEASRLAAYTTARSDILDLVPASVLRVLDLGCSDGTLGLALKARRADRHVTGIEYSADLAQRAAVKLDRLKQADLNHPEALTEFEGTQFDCAICADVLEHLQQPGDLLARLRPCLADGAVLVVSLPNIRHLSALVDIYLKGSFPRRQRGIFDDTHLRWFTLRDGHQLLLDAGFVVDQTAYSLRWGDRGGGRANKLLNRAFGTHAHRIAPVREFLSYQFAMRARLASNVSQSQSLRSRAAS